AADREELESVLAGDGEARAYVASLRETIDALERELGAQPAPAALDELQRQRIHGAASRRSRRGVWIASGLVASAAAGVGLVVVSAKTSWGAKPAVAIESPRPDDLVAHLNALESDVTALRVQQQGQGQVDNRDYAMSRVRITHASDGQTFEHHIDHNTE